MPHGVDARDTTTTRGAWRRWTVLVTLLAAMATLVVFYFVAAPRPASVVDYGVNAAFVETFSRRVQTAVDLGVVTDELSSAVGVALRPSMVALWLPDPVEAQVT